MKTKQIIVLAGGFGTRLSSILNGLPKPLADINGIPFLRYLLEIWVKNGLNDFIFSLHYQADKIIDYVDSEKNGILKNSKIRYIIEDQPLGTGGAISNVISKTEVQDMFYVTNADTYVDCPLNYFENQSLNTIAVLKMKNIERYGNVVFDELNFVESFSEKKQSKNEGYISAGFYKLNKSIFNSFKNFPYSIETYLFPILVQKKELAVVAVESDFIDIGIPEEYNKFCQLKKNQNESR